MNYTYIITEKNFACTLLFDFFASIHYFHFKFHTKLQQFNSKVTVSEFIENYTTTT